MRLLFIDESGSADGVTPRFALGGLVIRAEDWMYLRDELAKVKASCGVGPDIEIKWRHIRNPGGHKNPLRSLSVQQREALGRAILGIVRRCRTARVIGIIIDPSAANSNSSTPMTAEQIYERSVSFCMERYQYYLKAAQDIGLVVQDQRHTSQDRRLRAFYRSLLSRGTYWTAFPNVIEGVFLSDSEYSVGVQLADFVAGALYVAFGTPKKDPQFFNVIRGKITGNPKTQQRHGLKFWP